MGSVVNIREGPSIQYPVVDKAEQGDLLVIVGRSEGDDWWQMERDEGQLAWITDSYVETDEASADVGIVEAPPTPRIVAAVTSRGGSAPVQASAPANPSVPSPPPPGSPGSTNPLTGLPGDPARLARRPIAVVVNNSPVARPQYGLSAADVVYEYIMDGWYVTRFTAIFYGNEVERIGPVRSARLVNEQMTPQYQVALAAFGASDRVRYVLKHTVHSPYLDIDLDDPCNCTYSFSIGTHWETRLQTSTALLHKWLSNDGHERAPNLNAWPYADNSPGGVPASFVHIPYPSNSAVDWRYDSGSGRYQRSVSGASHVDAGTGQQLSAANVIVLYAHHELTDMVEDALGTKGIRIILRGSGPVKVLRDGSAVEGTWRAEDPNQPPHFFGVESGEIPLKPGNTWVQVVPRNYDVRVE